jgi:hypothetical protein
MAKLSKAVKVFQIISILTSLSLSTIDRIIELIKTDKIYLKASTNKRNVVVFKLFE